METNDRHAQHMACWYTPLLQYPQRRRPFLRLKGAPTCRSPILDISQVAITVVYRYPGRVGVLLSPKNPVLVAAPFSHTTPCSHVIEERQAMRDL